MYPSAAALTTPTSRKPVSREWDRQSVLESITVDGGWGAAVILPIVLMDCGREEARARLATSELYKWYYFS